MSTPSINNTSHTNLQETFSPDAEGLQQAGELAGISIAEASHNPSPATHQQAPQERSSHLLRPFAQVRTFVHTLWNSVPAFFVERYRQSLVQEKENFIREHQSCSLFGFQDEFAAALQAYDALLELPASEYLFKASALYSNLHTAKQNVIEADDRVFNISASRTPEALERRRQSLIEEKNEFIGTYERFSADSRLHLINEFNAAIEAYDALIALMNQQPSAYYNSRGQELNRTMLDARHHFNEAMQRHTRQTREDQERQDQERMWAAANADTGDDSESRPGAYYVSEVNETTRADDIAQADDATAGRAGRVSEILTATTAEDLPEAEDVIEITSEDFEQDTTTRRVAVEPNLTVHEGARIAEANYPENQVRIDAAAAARARAARLGIPDTEEKTTLDQS